jgi:tetratricopeptide (TPR) repeat protein
VTGDRDVTTAAGRLPRRWVLVAASIALSAVGALAYWFASEAPVRTDAEQARRAVRTRRFDEALAPLGRWLRAQPSSAEAHLLRARVAHARGDLAILEREIARAQALGGDPEEIRRLDALRLAASGRIAESEPILVERFRDASRPDPEVSRALASIYLRTYRFAAAEVVLKRWAAEAPDDPTPYLWMTEIDNRAEQGGPSRAAEHYREALRRDPSLDEARLGLAEALRESHQYELAGAEFGRYLKDHPDDPAALVGSARAAQALGKLDEAERLLDHALSVAPDPSEALRERAGIDLSRGHAASALRRLDAALEIDPFDAESHARRSLALNRLGRYDEAEAARERSESLRADELRLQETQRQFNLDPSNDRLRLEIARWMIEHGQGEQGVRWIQTILASDPGHPAANRLLAEYHEDRGDPGLANFYRLQARADREPD